MATYLVTKTTYFVDPHGSPDEGGVEKFITDNPYYLQFNTPDDKFVQHDELVDADDLRGSEDGYNSEVYSYSVREITDQKEIDYTNLILDAYKKL